MVYFIVCEKWLKISGGWIHPDIYSPGYAPAGSGGSRTDSQALRGGPPTKGVMECGMEQSIFTIYVHCTVLHYTSLDFELVTAKLMIKELFMSAVYTTKKLDLKKDQPWGFEN